MGKEVITNVFENELSKLPKEFSEGLKRKAKKIEPLIKAIKEAAKDKSLGFYITPKINVSENGIPVPDLNEITLVFMLDDFERPIVSFSPEILLGDKFDKFLSKKDKNGNPVYYLKNDKSIKFKGTSISILREECFDSNYESLKEISNSIIYFDPRKYLMALKTIEIHKNMVLRKFEKYVVVYAGAGSWTRGEKSNDFDVYVVIDDTDVKTMPRYEVKSRLTSIMYEFAGQVAALTGIQLHIQTYLLTDFWDALKDAHPVIFTFLRDGVPFYDRGLFNSWKELLKLGKVRPSPEAIEMHMSMGNTLIDRAKNRLKEILMEDVYYAILSPSQAIIMLLGFNPTTPKETVKMFKEVLYEKEKLINKKEFEILKKVVEKFKALEHGKETISGSEIEKFIKDAESYLKKIKSIFESISEERKKESVISIYNEVISNLKALGIFDNFEKNFENFVKENDLPYFTVTSLKQVLKAKKDYDEGNITITEVNKTIKEGRILLSELRNIREKEFLERSLGRKIVVKTDKKSYYLVNILGELYLYNEKETYKLSNDTFVPLNEMMSVDIDKLEPVVFNDKVHKALEKILNSKEYNIMI